MPTEDVKSEPGKAFIKTEDGEMHELKEISKVEVASENNDDAIDAMEYATDTMKERTLNITISIESSIQMQKMLGINRISRKRFIKLLMGCRIQKNDAAKFADIVRKTELSYCPLMVQATVEWCISQMEEQSSDN